MLSVMGFVWVAVSLVMGDTGISFWAPLVIANVCFVGDAII